MSEHFDVIKKAREGHMDDVLFEESLSESKINGYVTDGETVYFVIMLIISILCYFILTVSIIGILYILLIGLFLLLMQAFCIGHIKQNTVKITKNQFKEIYDIVEKYSKKLNIKNMPDVYLMQSGGVLNALATRFLFKDIVILYSDILELAYEQGENAVNFIIAHELAHIKRKHISKKKYILCAEIIPFLGLAYSRACEKTCDKIAAAIVEKSPIEGLLVLAAGKKLYKKVNPSYFVSEAYNEKGFWGWFSEICSTHPHLATRVRYLKIQDSVFFN